MIIKIKNFIVRAILIILALVLLFEISAVCFMFFAFGSQYIEITDFSPGYINRNLYTAQYFIQQLVYYTQWMIENKTIIAYNTNNYFVLKLYLPLILLYSILIGIFMWKHNEFFDWKPFKIKESLHGDARWATQEDITRAGLRSKSGMLLGKDDNGYYVATGFQHALLFAPTGSGKGVGFVIPNLLFWEHSCIVHDIKLENHQITSGYRAKAGQKVYVWAPAEPDGKTHCYNPIDWVSNKPGQMVDDVQKIANLVLPEKEFWNNEARSLFVGVVLYLIAVPEKVKSFGEVVRTMRSDDVVYNLAVVLDTIGKYIHPVAYMNIAAFLQKADKERSGVISTLNSGLELWANPLIDTATASSDFNIQNFKKERTTVFVGLTPDNIKRLEILMQIFYQQATEFLSRKLPNKSEDPYGVLFIMDEFPTLGKMETFKTGIAYFRGYNVRLFLIIQDTQQLKGIYEEAGMNSFLSNATFRITFAANNVETANLISQLCGNKTVEQSSQSRPKFLDFNPASRSENVSEVQRALLLPQEVILLPKDDQIVLIESFPPIKSKKIKYYEDRFFKKRLLPETTIPTQEPYDPNRARGNMAAKPAETEQTQEEQT
jgi:type IV secretion system protein VirD4